MKVFKKKEKKEESTRTATSEVAAAAAALGLVYNSEVDFNNWSCPEGMLPDCIPMIESVRIENIRPARAFGMVVFVVLFTDYSGSHCISREKIMLSLVPDTRTVSKPSNWQISEEEKERLNRELDEDGAWE